MNVWKLTEESCLYLVGVSEPVPYSIWSMGDRHKMIVGMDKPKDDIALITIRQSAIQEFEDQTGIKTEDGAHVAVHFIDTI